MISMNSSLINHALSDQLAREVEEFLARGGKVKSEGIQRRDIDELTPDFKRDFVISGRKPEMVKAEKNEEKEPKPKKEKVKVIKPKPEPKPKREPKPKKEVLRVFRVKPLPKPKPEPKPKKVKQVLVSDHTLRARFNHEAYKKILAEGKIVFEGKCKHHGLTKYRIYGKKYCCCQCVKNATEARSVKNREKRDPRQIKNEQLKKEAVAAGLEKFDAECLHHGLTGYKLFVNRKGHAIMRCIKCETEKNKRTVEKRKEVPYRDCERNSFIRNELFDRRISCVALAEAISASPSALNKIKRGEQPCSDRLWQAVNQFFEKLDK